MSFWSKVRDFVWPFVRKSSLESLQADLKRKTIEFDSAIASYKGEIVRLNQEVDKTREGKAEAERIAIAFQRRFEEEMRSSSMLIHAEPMRRVMREILRLVESESHAFVAIMSPVKINWEPSPPMDNRFQNRRVEMIRIGFSMGMTEECPPELVARQISEQVHDAILQNWQKQSIIHRI